MENKQSITEEILKKESVGYIKSKQNLLQGTLFMTPKKIYLETRKHTSSGLAHLWHLIKHTPEKQDIVFDLEYNNIYAVSRGIHVVQNNVLEIMNRNNNTYRVIVKNYQEWEREIKRKIG